MFCMHLFGSSLTPASIIKYNSKLNSKGATDRDSEEHSQLIQDVEELNHFIATSNIRRDLPTIDLARQSYRASLKKQGNKKKRILKFTDKDLTDGVHPSNHLRETWANYMAPVVTKILKKMEDKRNEETLSSETEEEEPESWNFKRQQNH